MRRLGTVPALGLALATAVPAAADGLYNYREEPADPPALEVPRDDPAARSAPAVVHVGGYVSVQVNVDAAGMNIVGDAANEPSIGVDPNDPDNLVIAWRQFDSIASNFRQAGWAYSFDRGASWTFPGSLTPGTFRSDPVIDTDSSGTFFYNSLQGDFDADVFVSFDGGVSWGAPIPAFGGDKNWMVVDRSGGIGDGNVYETWQLVGGCCGDDHFTRWAAGGAGFEQPVETANTPTLGTMAVGPDGEVFMTGVEAFGNDFVVSRSDNAQDPSQTPTFAGSTVDLGGIFGAGLFGENPNPGGLVGQVWVATDRSTGPTGGHVYVLSSVDPPSSDPQDVYIARSVDGGQTWGAPRRVNDDPENADAWQWFGTLSVSPEGRLDVIWNDTRESLDATRSRLYYAYSWDGGESWSDNVAVSPEFDSHVGWPNQNKIGDYYDMVSDREGLDVAYSATFNGEQDVYYVRLFPDCNDNGVADATDIDGGASADLNADLVPDECQLVLGEPDPGQAGVDNEFIAEAGTPGETVWFVFGREAGSTPVPGCDGEAIEMASPGVLGTAVVGADGRAILTVEIPGAGSGETAGFQAVEAGTCTVSNRVLVAFP